MGFSCAAALWLTILQICMIDIRSIVKHFLHYSTFFSYPHLSQVVPHVVHLVQSLRTDGLPNSKAFLLQFAELIHCMMYQYSGFPDLYDNILEAVKVKVIHSLNNMLITSYSPGSRAVNCTAAFICHLRISRNRQKRRSSWC